MAGTLRMFAEELSSDSVKVARAHAGNPAPMPAGTVWGAADHEVRPRYHLDLGPERYALYFDEKRAPDYGLSLAAARRTDVEGAQYPLPIAQKGAALVPSR